MRNIIITCLLLIVSFKAFTQKTVHIKIQIENFNSDDLVYFGVDGKLLNKLASKSGSGSFSMNVNIEQLPSYISFVSYLKTGKIENHLPSLWFGKDSVSIKINWLNKSFQSTDLSPFQEIAEKIETLNGKDKINYILKYPNQIPGLYYAERNKHEIPIADLATFIAEIPDEFKNLNSTKRIENYMLAKKLGEVKIGKRFIDFSLPDKEGNSVSILKPTGKLKLITLFSSSCHWSIESITLIEDLNNLNNGKIEIITIWTDQNRATWLDYEKDKKAKISWTNLWDEYGFANAYLDSEVSPSYYVINEKGDLIDKFHISKSTEKKLKRLFE